MILILPIAALFIAEIFALRHYIKIMYPKIGWNTLLSKSLCSLIFVATAIAAQVGTGNIVGACGAILIGGPGAIFWMWVIAFFGMATIYAEAILAQETRIIKEDGSILGGPVYYIKKAFSGKFGRVLATFFAVAIIIACGFIGAMVQSNSIASNIVGVFNSFGNDFSGYVWIIGLVVAALNANGTTRVSGIEYIDRGYESIENILSKLGARISRISV